MLKVRYPIIVEGKYDKIKLSSLVEGDILTTDGFGIFKDKEKLAFIRLLAEKSPIILLTDSDRAGFRIRGYLSGAVPTNRLIHLYIPEIFGKEQRKDAPSAEGTLGVEGMPADILRRAFSEAGVLDDGSLSTSPPVTKAQLFALGLCGGDGSAVLRRKVQQRLGLPTKLSANALCGILPRITTQDELEKLVSELKTD
ncbi:MAG: DUF4093 domain-containing protein [Angelakisella sp.]